MKRQIASLMFVLSACVAFGQMKPPQQTDTLYIHSVKYNYADIRQENWPCEVIYKSTTSFRIGEDEFFVKSVDKFVSEITFYVSPAGDTRQYKLLYEEEYNGDIRVTFSGYEFLCRTRPLAVSVPEPQQTVSESVTFQLADREANGVLPVPSYDGTVSGTVVVQVWVDNYGQVQKAVAGVEGTTISDQAIWQAARKAALGAHFNMSADAPALQEGTITYMFGEEEVDEGEAIPFQLVEEKPSFQGSDANRFSNWVNQHLNYPEAAKKKGVQGRVTLHFTIGSDGSVRNVRVLRGVDPALDSEAVRVVSMSPKWEPGKQRGKPVPVTYTFPVIFQVR